MNLGLFTSILTHPMWMVGVLGYVKTEKWSYCYFPIILYGILLFFAGVYIFCQRVASQRDPLQPLFSLKGSYQFILAVPYAGYHILTCYAFMKEKMTVSHYVLLSAPSDFLFHLLLSRIILRRRLPFTLESLMPTLFSSVGYIFYEIVSYKSLSSFTVTAETSVASATQTGIYIVIAARLCVVLRGLLSRRFVLLQAREDKLFRNTIEEESLQVDLLSASSLEGSDPSTSARIAASMAEEKQRKRRISLEKHTSHAELIHVASMPKHGTQALPEQQKKDILLNLHLFGDLESAAYHSPHVHHMPSRWFRIFHTSWASARSNRIKPAEDPDQFCLNRCPLCCQDNSEVVLKTMRSSSSKPERRLGRGKGRRGRRGSDDERKFRQQSTTPGGVACNHGCGICCKNYKAAGGKDALGADCMCEDVRLSKLDLLFDSPIYDFELLSSTPSNTFELHAVIGGLSIVPLSIMLAFVHRGELRTAFANMFNSSFAGMGADSASGGQNFGVLLGLSLLVVLQPVALSFLTFEGSTAHYTGANLFMNVIGVILSTLLCDRSGMLTTFQALGLALFALSHILWHNYCQNIYVDRQIENNINNFKRYLPVPASELNQYRLHAVEQQLKLIMDLLGPHAVNQVIIDALISKDVRSLCMTADPTLPTRQVYDPLANTRHKQGLGGYPRPYPHLLPPDELQKQLDVELREDAAKIVNTIAAQAAAAKEASYAPFPAKFAPAPSSAPIPLAPGFRPGTSSAPAFLLRPNTNNADDETSSDEESANIPAAVPARDSAPRIPARTTALSLSRSTRGSSLALAANAGASAPRLPLPTLISRNNSATSSLLPASTTGNETLRATASVSALPSLSNPGQRSSAANLTPDIARNASSSAVAGAVPASPSRVALNASAAPLSPAASKPVLPVSPSRAALAAAASRAGLIPSPSRPSQLASDEEGEPVVFTESRRQRSNPGNQ
eukprot:GILI01005094.1.p1 GENE.GILI01005094.1~~GILI01005094.1.p1  ORF type:complete len:960 (+),score=186.08 GILI01005094.1:110-2989(+)